ncbi:hypothetical protein THASP1DRAFT_29625 [Thamnocephalis sphaerospora]|uniref:Uncharacterized protein n=1 Tax=Thamnocephalis sphaerospora TaxID=78915 RepID=A0A4P9XR70_9FUNG|nr:hypothetical protein THASP1DRAFT_29625 [Thamnocephalis sphaerospora]|eukprot:RKP08577.1 hypothetical protein THASP1DRAFT_29625 [Thamnocephalis sphaerospora]
MTRTEETFAERILRRINGATVNTPPVRNVNATLENQLERAEKTGILSLANGKLKEIPDIFTVDLRSLDLNKNLLKFIPDDMARFADSLRHLTIADNRLAEVPLVIAQLTRLETLDLSGNRLTSVTSFPFEDLARLRVLRLQRNKIRTLPARIGACEQLRELDVSDNEIESLPPDLANAAALEELRCVGNQLTEVPTAWRRMRAVKVMRLDKNRLTKFPGELLRETPVVVVSISDNPMQEEDLHALEGYEEYSERRKDRCDQFLRS